MKRSILVLALLAIWLLSLCACAPKKQEPVRSTLPAESQPSEAITPKEWIDGLPENGKR